MITLSQVPKEMQYLFTTKADAAGLETGFVQRSCKLNGSCFTQTLVFSLLENPDATYTQMSQTAGVLGASITRQAIEQRFTPEAAETLKVVLDAAASTVIFADPQTLPLLEKFNGVYLQDSSWITLPDTLHETWEGGSKKNKPNTAAVKLHLRFDIATGTFEHFQLTNGITADSTIEKQIAMLPSGSLRLTDLGYYSLDTFQTLSDAGVLWISRYKVNCLLYDEIGEPFYLLKWLQKGSDNFKEEQIFIGKNKRLKARIVAQKLSETETQQRIRDIKHRAKRKHTKPSPERLQFARWNIYITNIGVDQLTAEQICAVARTRWQVELMYKCFKSIGKVDTSRSDKPYRILCELYAKLIVAIIRHWIMLAVGWKCLKHSLTKTAELITTYARTLAIGFRRSIMSLRQTFDEIKRAFQNGCYIERRANRDTTLEYLENAAKTH